MNVLCDYCLLKVTKNKDILMERRKVFIALQFNCCWSDYKIEVLSKARMEGVLLKTFFHGQKSKVLKGFEQVLNFYLFQFIFLLVNFLFRKNNALQVLTNYNRALRRDENFCINVSILFIFISNFHSNVPACHFTFKNVSISNHSL